MDEKAQRRHIRVRSPPFPNQHSEQALGTGWCQSCPKSVPLSGLFARKRHPWDYIDVAELVYAGGKRQNGDSDGKQSKNAIMEMSYEQI